MPYNFAAESFHTKKLCSRLYSRKTQFLYEKRSLCVCFIYFMTFYCAHHTVRHHTVSVGAKYERGGKRENKLGSEQQADGFHDRLNQLRRLRKDTYLRDVILVQGIKSLQHHRSRSTELIRLSYDLQRSFDHDLVL